MYFGVDYYPELRYRKDGKRLQEKNSGWVILWGCTDLKQLYSGHKSRRQAGTIPACISM